MRALDAALLCVLATAVGAAELLPGETIATEWLAASGADCSFAAGPLFAGDPANGATVAVDLAADGRRRLVVEETCGGNAPNAGSSCRFALGADSALVRRVNELLARPVTEPAVAFALACRIERLAASDKLIGCRLSGEFTGRQRPMGPLLVGTPDLRRWPGWKAGAALDLDAGCVPAFRFLVPATGGAARIDGVRFAIDLRIEANATPERVALQGLVLHEIAGPPITGSAGRLLCVGGAPSLGLLAAARSAGWTMLPTATDPGPGADLVLIARGCQDERTARAVVAALDAGAAVGFSLADFSKPHPALEQRLPVNAWSFAGWNLLRPGCAALPVDGGAFSVPGALAMASRGDLHLPGAPVENPMVRYEGERYTKGPLVSDWRSELVAGSDGGLPVLVTGRSGPGRIAVLATAWNDSELIASPGYAAFCAALLAWAAPAPPAPPAAQPAGMAIAIAPQQATGLAVTVRNPGPAPASAVLSWKTMSWGREHVLARSQDVRVPAGGEVRVVLDDATPANAIPWRRIDAALLTPDRRTVLARREAAVTVAAPLAVAIEEDPASATAPSDWALPRSDAWCDGRLARRYVYAAGEAPKLTVLVRNGLLDLAPLATARDIETPDNPTTGGLNDLSWSTSSVRGKGPWQGNWTGRPRATQRIALTWEAPVTVAAQRLHGYGAFRRWDRNNPASYVLIAGDGRELVRQDAATFASRRGDIHASHDDALAAPLGLSACELRIAGLDPKRDGEPHPDGPSNCGLMEWEVLGWPGATPPPSAQGELVVTATDLRTGAISELLRERIAVAAFASVAREVVVPTRQALTPMRIDVRYAGAASAHDCLFVPAGGTTLASRDRIADHQQGLLCSPGWVQTVGFGLGMRGQTSGWGGDDDKLWALAHGLMETSSHLRDQPARLFTTHVGASHYTNPWRDTPGGWYGWDLAADAILERVASQGMRSAHITGSDRWNGLNLGTAWGWDEFVAFDRWLRATGVPGLRGRSRGALIAEIQRFHGDRWQRWALERYADALLATKARFAARDVAFSFETHGSFPLCGGALGAKLAKTHRGVGTDLFWELRDQDLYGSLGSRFAVVAINPDLESGAYGQWSWVNSEANQWWFANSGGIDPARRQWYASYFAGRVDHAGAFRPYHALGFSYQGDHGTRMHPDDIAACVRTGQLASRIRPEAATGVGMVVSWATQERRMAPSQAGWSFGLSSTGEAIESAMGATYATLVKNGLPVSFVTSTHALSNWRGDRPLVLVDGFAWSDAELGELDRLNRAGTPLICLGDPGEVQGAAAPALFGVRRGPGGWEAATGTTRLDLAAGAEAFRCVRPGRAATLWCPLAPRMLPGRAGPELARAALAACGEPLALPVGVACTPFVSRGCLWLPLCDQGDRDRTAEVRVRPAALLPALTGEPLAIDLDGGKRLHGRWADGTLTFSVPLPASGGRMVLLAVP